MKDCVILAAIGALLLVIARSLSGGWQAAAYWIGMILCLAAGIILCFWMADNIAERYQTIQDTRDRTVRLAKEVRYLTEEQMLFIRDMRHIGTEQDVRTGEVYLRGTDAPMEFVEEFLSHSTPRGVCPIRAYPDTIKRDWAQDITRVLIESGFADPAAGNLSARWRAGVTPEFVARKLGLTIYPVDKTPDGWQEIPQ